MQTRTLKSDLLLLFAAAIWGFAFVAQRQGMQHIGPFLFNALRFALGTLVLLPFLPRRLPPQPQTSSWMGRFGGIILGLILFSGASLQQIGIVYTSAGKAGFITGLYVVMVPFVGWFLNHRINVEHWLAVLLTVIGLFFLTITSEFTIEKGDLFVLMGAFFWTGHVHLIGWLAPRTPTIRLAATQFMVCALLSLIAALFLEPVIGQNIYRAGVPLLYGGVMSVGVAFSLQVYGQKNAPPTHAAILLSLEAVFAVLGGWLILAEKLSSRSLFGCALMLLGMLSAQVRIFKSQRSVNIVVEN
ncbi:MAG: DMT family transporter [Calditrichaeota bacterium]|nr:MAG: DMT family transporter [Calditrichota bacterium]